MDLFDEIDEQIAETEKMNDMDESLESLNALIDQIAESGKVCRSQIYSLESIGFQWESENYPAESFTECPSIINHGVAVESLSELASKGISFLAEKSILVIIGILAAVIAYIVKFVGGGSSSGSSSKKQASPEEVKSSSRSILEATPEELEKAMKTDEAKKLKNTINNLNVNSIEAKIVPEVIMADVVSYVKSVQIAFVELSSIYNPGKLKELLAESTDETMAIAGQVFKITRDENAIKAFRAIVTPPGAITQMLTAISKHSGFTDDISKTGEEFVEEIKGSAKGVAVTKLKPFNDAYEAIRKLNTTKPPEDELDNTFKNVAEGKSIATVAVAKYISVKRDVYDDLKRSLEKIHEDMEALLKNDLIDPKKKKLKLENDIEQAKLDFPGRPMIQPFVEGYYKTLGIRATDMRNAINLVVLPMIKIALLYGDDAGKLSKVYVGYADKLEKIMSEKKK